MSDEVLGGYEAHVTREKTKYLLSYEAWETNLTPEERKILRSASAPDIEDHVSQGSRKVLIGLERDAADSSLASYEVNLADAVDSVVDEIRDKWGVDQKKAEEIARWAEGRIAQEAESRKASMIVKIAGVFLNCSNVRLVAAGLSYATDLALTTNMGTMQEWAIKNGLSRAAVSKSARWWSRELSLPVGSHMRDEETCRAYSEAQKTKHWRK
jgi:hypothetical protein